jgi:3-oxoacyl-[acyl-carrier protein] reductase
MDLGLSGKVAVITGGTVGIGLAIAEGLAAEGCNLVLVGRNQERGRAEAERIAAQFGVRAIAIAADVATAEGCDAVIAGSGKWISSSTMPAPGRTKPSRRPTTPNGNITGTCM